MGTVYLSSFFEFPISESPIKQWYWHISDLRDPDQRQPWRLVGRLHFARVAFATHSAEIAKTENRKQNALHSEGRYDARPSACS